MNEDGYGPIKQNFTIKKWAAAKMWPMGHGLWTLIISRVSSLTNLSAASWKA